MSITAEQACRCYSPVDLSAVDAIVRRTGDTPDRCIAILQALHDHYHWLPPEALRRVCEITSITPAQIVSVATFYNQFRHKPAGRHTLRVCHGTACHVKGSELVENAVRRHLGIGDEDDTDPQGMFTVERVGCVGCCTLAPVIQLDGMTYGHQDPHTIPHAVRDFLVHGESQGQEHVDHGNGNGDGDDRSQLRVGLGSCCVAGGSMAVYDALADAIGRDGAEVTLKSVACSGMCHSTPLVEVAIRGQPRKLYTHVNADDARWIVRKHFKPRGLWRRLRGAVSSLVDRLLVDGAVPPVERKGVDPRDGAVCEFLGRQLRIATEHYGHLAPLSIDEYVAREGFAALRKAVEIADGGRIIEMVSASGLRGRGGAGFPTGRKWQAVRDAPGGPRYVVCNGDEGDPGAFMDRMLLESFPYRVLEGLAIAAVAVGAEQGFLYIRAEYPLAVQRVTEAIRRAEAAGYLGDNVLGSGRRLRFEVRQGAGAFVCGEETALIASIEGRRGFPRLRPPFPAEKGLWNRPTLINNVETYAMVPWIIRRGPQAFAAIGTATSKGTKVFALTGKVRRGGLIEVPMGVTIRQIVREIGGGVRPGRRFKAVQIGGPSGGCIPAEMADLPVDYESLTQAGAIMGSGGLVVLDDTDCMVDMARYFLSFTQAESCGKCSLCRVGTRVMLDILEALCRGQAARDDLEKLEHLAGQVKIGSLCGLGQTAPNPVLTTLRYFRDEYEAHLAGRCPAGKCMALIKYVVQPECIGCTRCAQVCPADAIPMTPFEVHKIDVNKCTRCDACRSVCPVGAIRIV